MNVFSNTLDTLGLILYLGSPGSSSTKHLQPRGSANVLVSWQACCFPQVSGHVRANAKCWDTRTDAGALRRRGPTRVWPVGRICPPSTRLLHFPGTPRGRTTIQLSYPKPTGCKVCTKKSNTRNLITSSLVHRRRPEYRRRTRCPFQSTQTPEDQTWLKWDPVFILYSTFVLFESMLDCCSAFQCVYWLIYDCSLYHV